MSFRNKNKTGENIRRRCVLDCSESKILTEQAHKREVDINNIVKKHGIQHIESVSRLQSPDFRFDDVSGNDFQEAMEITTRAKEEFLTLPATIRKQFDNNPAQFLDFVQNPANNDQLVSMGLAQRTPAEPPVQVIITNPETQNPPVTNSETPPA